MLHLQANTLELRGVQTKISKKGITYYVLMCEDIDTAEPFSFYVSKYEMIPVGLKKGDLIDIWVAYNRFKELEVISIMRAD